MTVLWNVIKRRRSIQVKSSLAASDFNSFYGDVMQALPDSSHDQTCDKKIVDTHYLDNCQTREVQTIDAEQVNQFSMRVKRAQGLPLNALHSSMSWTQYATCPAASREGRQGRHSLALPPSE